MKPKPMFPYRRNKKRPRSGSRRQRDGGGRRVPQNAAELLSVLQPATKSLAQMLAGNAKASGQLVHARNVLAQAEKLVSDRAVERLPPLQREEFFEQFARLKLTVADAEAMFEEEEAAAETERTAEGTTEVSPEELRQVALSLAMTTTNAARKNAEGLGDEKNGSDEPAAPEPAGKSDPVPPVEPAQRAKPNLAPKSRERLRLKSVAVREGE